MIQIDGSQGDGGGQILRTSLSLSILTGQPFRMERIRAGREKPGLMRQHLTAVQAAAAICNGQVEGDAVGSSQLSFAPGKLAPGDHRFSVGTAGSTTLVLQTVLPPLLLASAPSTLILEGGTHNPHAPPADFLERAFLPLINRMGPKVRLTLERAGFYPAGGGRLRVEIEPASQLTALNLIQRGPIQHRVARALVAGLPGSIAARELGRVEESLGWSGEQLKIRQLPAEWGPGNILLLEIGSEHVTEVFTGFGMKGVSAEAVAEDAVAQAQSYLAAGAPVGPCLADQLLLPLSIAGGGSFATSALTRHTQTNSEIIAKFLPAHIETRAEGNQWHLSVRLS